MNFQATEDHVMVQQMVRRFVTEQILPHTIELAHHTTHTFHTLLSKLSELGLKGARASFAHEGSEMDAPSETFIIEELARGDLGLALMLAHHNLATQLLSQADHASTTDFSTGDKWAGIAFTGELSPDRLTLSCDFIPGGAHLTHLVVCTFDHAVLVDLSEATITPQPDALGMRASSPARITLENAPTQSLTLSPEQLRQAHITHHVHHAAAATGLAQAAYEVSAAYAHERKQFKKRLTSFQVTQFKLADMATRHQCARHMCYLATSPPSQGEALRCALDAHAFAIKAAAFIADEGVQLHGGYGYTSEYVIERHYRDAIALQSLGGGLATIQARAGEEFVEQAS